MFHFKIIISLRRKSVSLLRIYGEYFTHLSKNARSFLISSTVILQPAFSIASLHSSYDGIPLMIWAISLHEILSFSGLTASTQFEGYKARLDDDVVSEHLAGMRREWNYVNGDYGRTEVTLSLDVNNLNEFLNAKPGTVLFSRKTSVVLDEQDLYKLYAIEIAPGNISRMSFVRNNGEMVIDTMNVYQEVGFFSVDDRWGLDYSILTDVTKYLKKMRVLYVDEECPLVLTDRRFNEWPNLEKVYIGCLAGNIDAFLFDSCKKLETVRIGKGVTIVNANAFSYIDNLKHLIIGSTLDCGNGIVLDLLSLNDIDLISCPNIIIGDGVKVVNSLGYSLYLESLVIGRDVEQIVDRYYMRGVKKVVDLRLSSSEHDAYIEGLINLLHR